MTKKDYELIAEVLRANNTSYHLDALAVAFADRLRLGSPTFQKVRFLAACGCSNITVLANAK